MAVPCGLGGSLRHGPSAVDLGGIEGIMELRQGNSHGCDHVPCVCCIAKLTNLWALPQNVEGWVENALNTNTQTCHLHS